MARGRRGGSRGRSSSRRGRGRSGGQGSGGSGKGKGKGGSRGRSSGTRGGQGAGKGKGKGTGKGTGGSRGRSSNTRGGQHRANKNQNKKARRTVKSVKKAVSRVGRAIGKGFRGAAAHAANAVGVKKKSKLQQQISNFKARVKQMSTPEAKRERINKRLYNQFGLDYSRMNEGPTIKINPKQWLGGFTAKTGIPTKAIANRIPKFLSGNWINHTFRSPTKLGASDGWARKNAQYNKSMGKRNIWPGDTIDPAILTDTGPQQDWLGSLYRDHNIAGGKLDSKARDYWSNEASTKGRDAVIRSIIGTSKAQGTYGGRKKPQTIRLTPTYTKQKKASNKSKLKNDSKMIQSIAKALALRGINPYKGGVG